MELVLATIADSANISTEGNLNILGIFDTIQGPTFPLVHPRFSLALRLRLEYDDAKRDHSIEVSLLDEDGKRLWGGGAVISAGEIPPGIFTHVNQVVHFRSTTFARPGRYRIRFKIGDQDRQDIVFQVIAVAPTARPGA